MIFKYMEYLNAVSVGCYDVKILKRIRIHLFDQQFMQPLQFSHFLTGNGLVQ